MILTWGVLNLSGLFLLLWDLQAGPVLHTNVQKLLPSDLFFFFLLLQNLEVDPPLFAYIAVFFFRVLSGVDGNDGFVSFLLYAKIQSSSKMTQWSFPCSWHLVPETHHSTRFRPDPPPTVGDREQLSAGLAQLSGPFFGEAGESCASFLFAQGSFSFVAYRGLQGTTGRRLSGTGATTVRHTPGNWAV